jgi:hypothetical protein
LILQAGVNLALVNRQSHGNRRHEAHGHTGIPVAAGRPAANLDGLGNRRSDLRGRQQFGGFAVFTYCYRGQRTRIGFRQPGLESERIPALRHHDHYWIVFPFGCKIDLEPLAKVPGLRSNDAILAALGIDLTVKDPFCDNLFARFRQPIL